MTIPKCGAPVQALDTPYAWVRRGEGCRNPGTFPDGRCFHHTTCAPEKFWMFHPVDASDPWVDIEAELNDPDFTPDPDLLTLLADASTRLNATPVTDWEITYVDARFDDNGEQIERTGGIQCHCLALRSNADSSTLS